jgi:alkanesulfonate monooxygenase SsuD/methylene tetrahydromethanopterin reductase-like flavin-dependent oxidoreductase (luciferase family)
MTGVPHLGLLFDMRAPDWGTPAPDLYRAAVEMSAWADSHGFETITLNEHHNTEDGYVPSPMVLGAGIATRTERVRLVISALIVTLHHPIRVAEDLAVLDLLANGRLSVVLGAGYRRPEYEMFDVNWRRRPSIMEETVATLRAAWTGEPFEFRGTTVQVLPRPAQPGGPPLALAGSSEGSARRAARLGLAYQPVGRKWFEIYLEELGRLGADIPSGQAARGFESMAAGRGGARVPSFVHVAEDPDAAWAKIAPHAAHHVNVYASWAQRKDLTPFQAVEDPDELRRNGSHQVLTPDECVALCRAVGADGRFGFHPLIGGLDPDVGWESLELFDQQVRPRL